MNGSLWRSLLLLPLLVAPAASGQEVAGWSLLEASPQHPYRFEDGSFHDPDRGWIVNGDGEVYHTANGGESWVRQATLAGYLRSVSFLSASHGFIGTLDLPNLLYETRDGGLSYQDITDRIEGPTPLGICGLWAVSDDVIYGAGWYASPAHIIKTTDGGRTWTSQAMDDYAGSLIDVYFWDEQRGIAVGGSKGLELDGRAVVLLTEDGGATWSVRHTSSEIGEWSWKISFPTPTTGYVSVEQYSGGFPAKVLKTTDAGLTWTELAIPNSSHLQAIGFLTEDIGWASGRGTTSLTTDGGQTWAQIDLDGDINRFETFGDSLAYAMGHRIYRYASPPSTSIADNGGPSPALTLSEAFPNPTAGALSFSFALADARRVDVGVYDLLGRRVATVATGLQAAGTHEATWDGRDARGRSVGPGVYVVRLVGDGQQVTRRITRVR
ncbi:MAG: FlgD immunoglobulin-like domain containing protein [Bacteroidota bacterium]